MDIVARLQAVPSARGMCARNDAARAVPHNKHRDTCATAHYRRRPHNHQPPCRATTHGVHAKVPHTMAVTPAAQVAVAACRQRRRPTTATNAWRATPDNAVACPPTVACPSLAHRA